MAVFNWGFKDVVPRIKIFKGSDVFVKQNPISKHPETNIRKLK